MGIKHFRFGVFAVLSVMTMLFLCSAGTALAAPAYVIVDDATGGDCTSIGVWNPALKTCSLDRDLTATGPGVESGIKLEGDSMTLDGNGHSITWTTPGWSSKGVTVSGDNATVMNLTIIMFSEGINSFSNNALFAGNTIMNGSRGIFFHGDDVTISGNEISGSTTFEAILGGGYISTPINSEIVGNTIENNRIGIDVSHCIGARVYNNFLIGNETQAVSGVDTMFNLPAPIGGNTWSDYDTPSEGCNDLNGDGFCDSPYVFTGGQDNLPITNQPGCGRPDLNLSMNDVYWGSLSDYDNRELTIEYDVVSFFDVSAIDIEGISCSAGVGTLTPMPMTMTNTAPGQWDSAVRFSIPEGVAAFTTSVYGSAQDTCGNTYEYPGPYPGP